MSSLDDRMTKERNLQLLVSALKEEQQGSSTYKRGVMEIKSLMKESPTLGFAQLRQLIEQGPTYDGDVLSKQDRDLLLQNGMAEKVVVRGQQGYQAATYFGWDVYYAEVSNDARSS